MDKDLKADSVTTDKVKVGKNGRTSVSITGPNGCWTGTDGKVGITGKDGKDAVFYVRQRRCWSYRFNWQRRP